MGAGARSLAVSSAPPGSKRHSFLLLNRQRKHAVDRRSLLAFVRAIADELGPEREFSVVLVSDPRMTAYNRHYRGQDKPTDVLSFPGDGGYLGDVLISTDTAYNQALRSKTLEFGTNLRRLALHGLLHLMGYDHATDDGEMRAVERRLRRKFQC